MPSLNRSHSCLKRRKSAQPTFPLHFRSYRCYKPVKVSTSNISLVLGALWGDEAKGKITDILAPKSDLVLRYSGGNNAGHTLKTSKGTIKLKLIPSGILNDNCVNLVASGCVVDPEALLQEMEMLQNSQISIAKLQVDLDCHLVLPFHREVDRLDELSKSDAKIGTTLRGIGPTQSDKYRRIGIRFRDVVGDPQEFQIRWDRLFQFNDHLIRSYYAAKISSEEAQKYPRLSSEEMKKNLITQVEKIRPYLCEGRKLIAKTQATGKKILLEGAQGTFLDLMAGDYPYVTSSHPGFSGALIGTGLGPRDITRVIGVVKAYSTRVGNGPFPSEISGDLCTHIREKGREFGSVTGRPRRIGWLDLSFLRRSVQMNGITEIALTLLDVLSGQSEIKVRDEDENGKETWQTFKGWSPELTSVRKKDQLPREALEYIAFIEEKLKTPVSMISVGPDREETIFV